MSKRWERIKKLLAKADTAIALLNVVVSLVSLALAVLIGLAGNAIYDLLRQSAGKVGQVLSGASFVLFILVAILAGVLANALSSVFLSAGNRRTGERTLRTPAQALQEEDPRLFQAIRSDLDRLLSPAQDREKVGSV
jgi:nitrogen fixation/metabolism regulation signal transduction histidine kinase